MARHQPTVKHQPPTSITRPRSGHAPTYSKTSTAYFHALAQEVATHQPTAKHQPPTSMHWPKKWPCTNLPQNINRLLPCTGPRSGHAPTYSKTSTAYNTPTTISRKTSSALGWHTHIPHAACNRKWQDFVELPQRSALLGCNLAIGNTCGKVQFHVPCCTAAANHSTDKWHYCNQSQHRQGALLQPITAQTSGTIATNHSTDKWHSCSQSQNRQVSSGSHNHNGGLHRPLNSETSNGESSHLVSKPRNCLGTHLHVRLLVKINLQRKMAAAWAM